MRFTLKDFVNVYADEYIKIIQDNQIVFDGNKDTLKRGWYDNLLTSYIDNITIKPHAIKIVLESLKD